MICSLQPTTHVHYVTMTIIAYIIILINSIILHRTRGSPAIKRGQSDYSLTGNVRNPILSCCSAIGAEGDAEGLAGHPHLLESLADRDASRLLLGRSVGLHELLACLGECLLGLGECLLCLLDRRRLLGGGQREAATGDDLGLVGRTNLDDGVPAPGAGVDRRGVGGTRGRVAVDEQRVGVGAIQQCVTARCTIDVDREVLHRQLRGCHRGGVGRGLGVGVVHRGDGPLVGHRRRCLRGDDDGAEDGGEQCRLDDGDPAAIHGNAPCAKWGTWKVSSN